MLHRVPDQGDASERGCNVVGIEIDPDAALVAEQWAEQVVVGNIDEGEVWDYVKDEAFDVVVLGDVLEHLRDPLGSLRQAVRKIKPTGYVVTSLPNIAHGDVRIGASCRGDSATPADGSPGPDAHAVLHPRDHP